MNAPQLVRVPWLVPLLLVALVGYSEICVEAAATLQRPFLVLKCNHAEDLFQ